MTQNVFEYKMSLNKTKQHRITFCAIKYTVNSDPKMCEKLDNVAVSAGIAASSVVCASRIKSDWQILGINTPTPIGPFDVTAVIKAIKVLKVFTDN